MTSHCFVPGCATGYMKTRRVNKELGKKNPALFSAPKDDVLLKKWMIAIRRKDQVLLSRHKVCELHFEEECILRTFETLCKNGEIFILDRERPLLKPGSIPSKFPNRPSSSPNKKISKHKTPAAKKICTTANEHVEQYSIANKDVIMVEDKVTYFDLLREISSITMPKNWICNETENCLLFMKINADFQCERHVVINEDLSIRVFIDNKEMNSLIPQMNLINSGSVTKILRYVDDIIICKGLHSRKKNCMGFVEEKASGADRNLCQACANDKTIKVKPRRHY